MLMLGDRLQLQGELQAKGDAPKSYKGVLHGVGVILKNEGPRGLFQGLGAAVRRLPVLFAILLRVALLLTHPSR